MSRCSSCQQPVTWLRRPNGSWYPPFEYDDTLESAEYEVSSATGEFIATLVDTDITVRVAKHNCKEYRQKEQAIVVDDRNHDYWRGYTDAQQQIKPKEIVVVAQPTPEQYIRQAKKLARICSVCDAGFMEWCVYVKDPEKNTYLLHSTR